METDRPICEEPEISDELHAANQRYNKLFDDYSDLARESDERFKRLNEAHFKLGEYCGNLTRENAELTAKLQQVNMRLADLLLQETEEEVGTKGRAL